VIQQKAALGRCITGRSNVLRSERTPQPRWVFGGVKWGGLGLR
jgi:hypothetical protein